MSSDIVYAALREFITEIWTETPIAWPNEPFSDPEPPAPWIMVQMQGADYEQQSIGAETPSANRWVETGSLYVHVFVPVGTGELEATRLARVMAEFLRGIELPGDIQLDGMSIGAGERGDEDGNWWRVSLFAHYQRG